jgi:triacylglycerol lipase
MLARLQRFLTLGLILTALAWAGCFASRGSSGWAAAGALLILAGYALFLGIEFVLLAFVHADDPAPRASASTLLRAWWGEATTAPRVFCWRQPFREQAEPDHLGAELRGRRGVVLVHGFVCNRALWNPWMRELRRNGVPFAAVSLEPVFGSIDDYTSIVDDAVRRVEAVSGLPPLVVAHSMGGLAVRAWLDRHAADARVHRVITIASPHHGTWLARWALTPNGIQMQRGSAWLQALAAREPAARFERFSCFYGHCDNIVFPPSTATLAGAANVHLPGTAHVHMAFHPAVFSEVCRWVAPSAAAGSVEGRVAQ